VPGRCPQPGLDGFLLDLDRLARLGFGLGPNSEHFLFQIAQIPFLDLLEINFICYWESFATWHSANIVAIFQLAKCKKCLRGITHTKNTCRNVATLINSVCSILKLKEPDKKIKALLIEWRFKGCQKFFGIVLIIFSHELAQTPVCVAYFWTSISGSSKVFGNNDAISTSYIRFHVLHL